MTVYSINLGLGWASSGVEYAQKYRAESFRRIGVKAKFIFSDLILGNNIEDLTKNMGFSDDEIIWLYNFFTDIKIAPSTYTLKQLKNDLSFSKRQVTQLKTANGQEISYEFRPEHLKLTARFHDKKQQTIDQVTYFNGDQISWRDFYSYKKYATEYYSKDNKVVLRQFYNEDGSIAYVEHLDGKQETFEFPDQRLFYSKNDLYRAMIRGLHLQKDDVIIMDREDESKDLTNGQIIFEEHRPAKLLVVVHADHYDIHYTNQYHILWNNFYEYQFTHAAEVDSFIVATPSQQQLLIKQEQQYYKQKVRVDCIPVGCLPQLRYPQEARQAYSLITASRLAPEKHLDWIVKAVIAAKKELPQLTLDIYGQGGKYAQLAQIIADQQAGSYIHLKGQQNLDQIYAHYAAYIAASTSEGFGLSLLEAVGSGLPMIGYDVPYGNPTFIDNGKNGYLLPYQEDWSEPKKIQVLTNAIVKLFTQADLASFEKHSYAIAEPYLLKNIALKWQKLLEELKHD